MNKKHLCLDDRYKIEEGLNEGKSFKKLALLVEKDCTTISKEVRKNRVLTKPSIFNNGHNNICKIKKDCVYMYLCNSQCNNICRFCSKCNSVCPDFIPDTCELLDNPPYVCNGCSDRRYCRKIKYVYKGKEANENYLNILSSSRKGINISKEEFLIVKEIVIPAIRQGHSPAMIIMNNSNIKRSESSIYRDIDNGLYESINNADLPRKVKFRKRIVNIEKEPKNTKNRENRTYMDFLNYRNSHPYAKIVQFDTVEGIKGGKCLFTIHFPSISYMIASLIDSQKAKIIVSKMEYIKKSMERKILY